VHAHNYTLDTADSVGSQGSKKGVSLVATTPIPETGNRLVTREYPEYIGALSRKLVLFASRPNYFSPYDERQQGTFSGMFFVFALGERKNENGK
jgi:hypothetical protein